MQPAIRTKGAPAALTRGHGQLIKSFSSTIHVLVENLRIGFKMGLRCWARLPSGVATMAKGVLAVATYGGAPLCGLGVFPEVLLQSAVVAWVNRLQLLRHARLNTPLS